jgi:hypothetical protein
MTTAIAPILQSGASSAAWIAMLKGVSDLLTAAGLTKTADTGQVDWATASRPAGTATSVGYEIRTIPVSTGTLTVKIEYMTGNSYTTNFGLLWSFGTGSNGSGTITGALGATISQITNYGLSADSVAYPCYASTWDGGFALVLWPQNATEYLRVFMVFDKTCDSDGTLNSNGCLQTFSFNSTAYAYGYSNTLGVRAAFTTYPARLPYFYWLARPSSMDDGKRLFSVVRHLTPAPNWHKNVLVGFVNDCPLGSTFRVNVCGAERTYLSVGVIVNSLNGNTTGNTADLQGALCIRWE